MEERSSRSVTHPAERRADRALLSSVRTGRQFYPKPQLSPSPRTRSVCSSVLFLSLLPPPLPLRSAPLLQHCGESFEWALL